MDKALRQQARAPKRVGVSAAAMNAARKAAEFFLVNTPQLGADGKSYVAGQVMRVCGMQTPVIPAAVQARFYGSGEAAKLIGLKNDWHMVRDDDYKALVASQDPDKLAGREPLGIWRVDDTNGQRTTFVWLPAGIEVLRDMFGPNRAPDNVVNI